MYKYIYIYIYTHCIASHRPPRAAAASASPSTPLATKPWTSRSRVTAWSTSEAFASARTAAEKSARNRAWPALSAVWPQHHSAKQSCCVLPIASSPRCCGRAARPGRPSSAGSSAAGARSTVENLKLH